MADVRVDLHPGIVLLHVLARLFATGGPTHIRGLGSGRWHTRGRILTDHVLGLSIEVMAATETG